VQDFTGSRGGHQYRQLARLSVSHQWRGTKELDLVTIALDSASRVGGGQVKSEPPSTFTFAPVV